MTTEEFLCVAATAAQSFASMNRTNPLRIETFPHVGISADDRDADGIEWGEGETAWEVAGYFGETAGNVSAVRKSLAEAAAAFLPKMADALRKVEDRYRSEGRRAREGEERIAAVIARALSGGES